MKFESKVNFIPFLSLIFLCKWLINAGSIGTEAEWLLQGKWMLTEATIYEVSHLTNYQEGGLTPKLEALNHPIWGNIHFSTSSCYQYHCLTYAHVWTRQITTLDLWAEKQTTIFVSVENQYAFGGTLHRLLFSLWRKIFASWSVVAAGAPGDQNTA